VGPETYLLIINASRIGPDFLWLSGKTQDFGGKDHVIMKNVSSEYAAVAVQGPAVADFIDNAIPGNGLMQVDKPTDLKKNQMDAFMLGQEDLFVARTGYTGEDGFEIVAPVDCINEVWEHLLLAGESTGLKPCGLGARDTLRLEMGYPLYGNELTEQITPIEAGLSYFVKLDKGDFIGRVPLVEQKDKSPDRRSVAFRMVGKSPPPRYDYTVWGVDKIWHTGDQSILGKVTSGNQSPSLGVGIGLAMVQSHYTKIGSRFEVNIRNKHMPAEVVRKPFYNPKK
jgi:aminomethyltransferase